MDFYFAFIYTCLLSLANASQFTTQAPNFQNCGFNMSATCDDVMWLFADGDLLVGNASDWRVTSEVQIPTNTKVIEIHCLDSWIHGGILAASDNGLITDRTWNCSSDNRTTWNPAYLLSRNGRTAPDISPEAIWIWTDMSNWIQTDDRNHTKAICKIELEASQCPPTCPPFSEPVRTTTPIPTTTTTIRTTTPSKSKPGFNLTATCDSDMKLFVDGNLVATSNNWRDTSKVIIPANTKAVEIHCKDSGINGGILASSDNGLLTDGVWNCSIDNGSTWNAAYEVGPNGEAVPDISPEAEWIWTGCIGDWTSKYTGKKYPKNVICKINLKPVIDGGWSAWSAFSSCSTSCGDATKARTRTCSNPPPSNGGDPCHGSDEVVVSCGLSPCDGQSCLYTDKYRDCPKWKKHCKSGPWTECMNENCPETCKCTTTTTTAAATTTKIKTKSTTTTDTTTSSSGTTTITTTIKTVYLMAGGHPSTTYRDIEFYNPTIEKLTCSINPPQLNNKWKYHTNFFHNNTIHLCGGTWTPSICISYNTDMNESTTHTLTTSRKLGHSSAILENRVYFIGGNYPDYPVAESTPLPLTNQPVFTPVPNLDYKGYHQCVVKIDDANLVITGGYDNSGYISNVTQYNSQTSTATSLPSLKQARYKHGCVMVELDNSKWIIVTGGYIGKNHLKTTEMLELEGGPGVYLGNINGERYGHTTIASERGVLVMGGYRKNVGYLASVEILDWSSKKWNVVQPSLNQPRFLISGVMEIPASMFNCTGEQRKKFFRTSSLSRHGQKASKLPNFPEKADQEHSNIPKLPKQTGQETSNTPKLPEKENTNMVNLPGHTEVKLQFQLKGKIGTEKVKISVDDTEEEFVLTTEWRLFSYPRPSTGSFSVEFLNDIGYTDVFIRGHESQLTDLLPNFPSNKFLGCGTKNEDEKCGLLRKGTLMWNGKYTYTLKGQ